MPAESISSENQSNCNVIAAAPDLPVVDMVTGSGFLDSCGNPWNRPES